MSSAETNPDACAVVPGNRAGFSLLRRPGFLVRRLHQIHLALFLDETAGEGLTPVQFSVLTALAELGRLDQASLAKAIGLERTGVAEVLPRLAKRGLVSRQTSSADRRVKLVHLTPEGFALVARLQSAVARAHARLIAPLNLAARAQFLAQLELLVEANNDCCVAPQRLP